METKAINNNSNRIYSLDVLRILATFSILIYHFEQVFDFTGKGIIDFTVKMNGSLIVEFFFVLSGFLAFHDIKKIQDGGVSFGSYVVKKVKRLIPVIIFPCIAYTLICFLMRGITGNGGWIFDTVVDIPATFAAMFGFQFWGIIDGNFVNYPLWYVDVLLLCYIVMAAVVKISKRLSVKTIYFFFGIIALGIVLWNNEVTVPLLNESVARGYYAFFWGVIVGKIYNESKERRFEKAWALFVLLFVAVGSIWLVVNKPDWFGNNARYVLTFISYPALLLTFVNPILKKIFDFKCIGSVGKVTYDVYAWHLVVYLFSAFLRRLNVINESFFSYTGMAVLVIISVIVGTVSYFIIDKFSNWLISRVVSFFK